MLSAEKGRVELRRRRLESVRRWRAAAALALAVTARSFAEVEIVAQVGPASFSVRGPWDPENSGVDV